MAAVARRRRRCENVSLRSSPGLVPMKAVLPFAAIVAAAIVQACTASVYHPTKSNAEMQADVNRCTGQANRRYWMDPVAALYNAYDCLEAKGYSRNEKDFAARVERALGERDPPAAAAAKASGDRPRRLPCQVPCKR